MKNKIQTTDLKVEDSESEGSVSPLSPIGYFFRFTFSDQDKELTCLENKQFLHGCKLLHRALLNKFLDLGYFYGQQYTSGFEIRSSKSGGEHCNAHIHISFFSDKLKNSMLKFLRRFMEEWDQDFVGNKCYSFKEQHIRDIDKFWRYPIKQSLDLSLCRGFSDEYLKVQHRVGNESWHVSCQVNSQKNDKKDNSDSLFLRFFSKYKKSTNDHSKRAIHNSFIAQYREENRPINRTVIMGYVALASLELGTITSDQLYDEWGY